MEALKLRGMPANGQLTVAVPDAFNNKEVEVIVLTAESEPSKGFDDPSTSSQEERIKRLLSVIGKAKYPDTAIDKYNVYEQ